LKRTTPVRGVTGVAGSGSGGVEPIPLSGYGGCNRRGSVLPWLDRPRHDASPGRWTRRVQPEPRLEH